MVNPYPLSCLSMTLRAAVLRLAVSLLAAAAPCLGQRKAVGGRRAPAAAVALRFYLRSSRHPETAALGLRKQVRFNISQTLSDLTTRSSGAPTADPA